MSKMTGSNRRFDELAVYLSGGVIISPELNRALEDDKLVLFVGAGASANPDSSLPQFEGPTAQLRAEIDPLVAWECFALTREEFVHFLDDFTRLRAREEKPPTGKGPGFGEFRTKRLALKAYDKVHLAVHARGGELAG